MDTGDLKMAHWLGGAGLLMAAPGLGKAVKDHNFWLGINTLGGARLRLPERRPDRASLTRLPRTGVSCTKAHGQAANK